MHVGPIKPKLKGAISEGLKLKCDDLLSNFAFIFNLRRYNKERGEIIAERFILNGVIPSRAAVADAERLFIPARMAGAL